MKPFIPSTALIRSLGATLCQKPLSCSSRSVTIRCVSSKHHARPLSTRPRLQGSVHSEGTKFSRAHSGCACRGTATRVRTAYIALGSNLGDRVAEIEKACNEMDRRGIRVKRTSSLWETEPMYVKDQDRFINGACEVCMPFSRIRTRAKRIQVETELEPLALLDELQAIERDMGRQKVIDKGPRNIDLDILLYGDEKVDHERLKVPHIGIPEREFVLRPLAEYVNPIKMSTLSLTLLKAHPLQVT